MDFETYSHRNGLELLNVHHQKEWNELKEVILSITDNDLMKQFPISKNKKSISAAVNNLLKERLSAKGWTPEAAIFQDPLYSAKKETTWRLDFAKEPISVEVSFNHGEALAWNLTKPVLASEMNHVRKAIQTKIGIVILATEEFKKDGAFDGAVGSYEKAIRYLLPMQQLLTVPLVLIGLKSPKTFKLVTEVRENNRKYGTIQMN